jgi:hypothetical protein
MQDQDKTQIQKDFEQGIAPDTKEDRGQTEAEIEALARAAALSPKEAGRRFGELLASLDWGGVFLSGLHVRANPRNIKRQSQKHKRHKARQMRGGRRG